MAEESNKIPFTRLPSNAPQTRDAMIAALQRHRERHGGIRRESVDKAVARLNAATGTKAVEKAMLKAADTLMNFLEREEKILDRIEADNAEAERRYGVVVDVGPPPPPAVPAVDWSADPPDGGGDSGDG